MIKQNFCIDCNKKLINYRAKRCKPCAYKHRRRIICCQDCHKILINHRAKRCKSCNAKFRNTISNNTSRYIDGRTLKQYFCECGHIITYQAYLYGQKKCKSCAQSKKMTGKLIGKKNPAYINGQGYFPYPLEFNNNLKLKIRKRDNYTCQNCGIIEEEHIIVYGKVLDVHHIDYDKENCKESNLITLCNQCNLRANFNRDYWKNYYKEKVKIGTI